MKAILSAAAFLAVFLLSLFASMLHGSPCSAQVGETQAENLALGKPVTVSNFEGDSKPAYAVDGDRTLEKWWGASPSPQWLQVDLEGVAWIDQITVRTYWDGGRSYQYTIDVSTDGVTWTKLVDWSTNETPSTADGFEHKPAPAEARFVRINMLANSANPGVHVAELEVFGVYLPVGIMGLIQTEDFAFGSQDIYAGPSAPVDLSIINIHSMGYLSVSDIALVGRDPGAFQIVSDTGEETLGAGASRILRIAFDPGRVGAHEAALVIKSNDEKRPALRLGLTGTGGGTLLPLIPQAESTEVLDGQLQLLPSSRIVIADESMDSHAKVLAGELRLVTGMELPVVAGPARPGDIHLQLKGELEEEQYSLEVDTRVGIEARDAEALARATASLVQLVSRDASVARVRLMDKPSFGYRALSIDVARKYHSPEVLKQIVDLCRFYKIRYLGLHLTDDQNFMFPSAAFPKLGGDNRDRPPYGKHELVNLERYAVDRGVTLIPELDIPGHSGSMVRAYPEVFGSLSGSTIDFQLPECVAGVKTLITEMLEVFPSATYFHIGGDESGFSHLDAFSGFVGELNDLVKAGGRTTMMWEGFHPGSAIPKDVLILNWESSYYAPDAMLEAGYTVVNAGWDPLYVVDHYPWVQYTYASQERLFRFDPFTFGHVAPGYPASQGIVVPRSSAVPGAEICWWEGRGNYAVPILRSRIPALAARLWNESGETSFPGFQQRFAATDARLEALLFPVQVSAQSALQEHWKPRQLFAGTTQVEMRSAQPGTIRYTLDGKAPASDSPAYEAPLGLAKDQVVSAALFVDGDRIGSTTRIAFVQVQPSPNLTTGKPVQTAAAVFPENPAALAVDGVIDRDSYWSTYPNPASLTIDLEDQVRLDGVTVFPRWGQGYYERYSVQLSADGETWTELVDFNSNSEPATSMGYEHKFPATSGRYLRLNTTSNSWFPAGRFPRIVEVQAHEAP